MRRVATWGASLLALGAIGAAVAPQSDVEQVVSRLKDGRPEARIEAARQLQQLGPQAAAAVPALTESLRSTHPELKAAAADALGAIGPAAKSAIPTLVGLLSDERLVMDPASADQPLPHLPVGVIAGRALGGIGEAALPDVLRALDRDQLPVFRAGCAAVHAMGKGAAPAALPKLLPVLQRQDRRVAPALFALQGLGPAAAPAVPALSDLLASLEYEQWRVQYYVCDALGAIGEPAAPAAPRLIELMSGGVTSVRRHAARALGDIGTAAGVEAIEPLREAVGDPKQTVGEEAVVALGKFGLMARPAVPTLEDAIRSPTFTAKSQAAKSLWLIDKTHADFVREVLIRELQSTGAPWHAAEALGEIGPRIDAVPQVVRLLESSNVETRLYSAAALGAMGQAARPALAPLRKLLQDEDEDVRETAAAAIRQIESS